MRDIPTYSRTPMKTVYLDYHATTPVDPRVLEAMLPFYGPKFGNAASGTHRFGWEAEGAVEVARQRIALLAGAEAREIVFTSGATESNNLALKGVVGGAGAAGAHIVTLATEHQAVLDTACTLERALDVVGLRPRMGRETVLVSLMYANMKSACCSRCGRSARCAARITCCS